MTESRPLSGTPESDAFAALARARTSVRGFTAQPVPDALLHELLVSARLAPSGANLQPGSFIQVRGAVREGLSQAMSAAYRDGSAEAEDYSYFPDPMPGHLRRRQVAAARALYDSIGIAREDRAGRDQQFERNFRFFDAPVALVVTIERGLGSGSFMDLGMALYGLCWPRSRVGWRAAQLAHWRRTPAWCGSMWGWGRTAISCVASRWAMRMQTHR